MTLPPHGFRTHDCALPDTLAHAIGRELPYETGAVTVDPAEGEAPTGARQAIVEAVTMPDPVRDAIAAFVAEHHVERAFKKRTGDSRRSRGRRHGTALCIGMTVTDDRDLLGRVRLQEFSADQIAIDAKSDIRAFLSAACRWIDSCVASPRLMSDPTIRDFVGLSENSQNFDAPSGCADSVR